METETAPIEIHTELIPNAVRDRLAIATLAFIKRELRDPQSREFIESRAAELRKHL